MDLVVFERDVVLYTAEERKNKNMNIHQKKEGSSGFYRTGL